MIITEKYARKQVNAALASLLEASGTRAFPDEVWDDLASRGLVQQLTTAGDKDAVASALTRLIAEAGYWFGVWQRDLARRHLPMGGRRTAQEEDEPGAAEPDLAPDELERAWAYSELVAAAVSATRCTKCLWQALGRPELAGDHVCVRCFRQDVLGGRVLAEGQAITLVHALKVRDLIGVTPTQTGGRLPAHVAVTQNTSDAECLRIANDLRRVDKWVREEMGAPWEFGWGAWFALTGNIPYIAPVDVRCYYKAGQAAGARRLIEMKAEPWVSVDSIARIYQHVRKRETGQERSRPHGVETYAVFRWVEAQTEARRARKPWHALWERWCSERPESEYARANTPDPFRLAYGRARRALLGL